MSVHELKTWPAYFEAVRAGMKTFELRRDDRDFKVGDLLVLSEWNPETMGYTGRTFGVDVTYILRGAEAVQFGLTFGFCIMGISGKRASWRDAPRASLADQDFDRGED